MIRKDYTGQTINSRKVLGLFGLTKNNDPLWTVRCICGAEFESLSQDLKRKTCRFCPSEKRKRPHETTYNSFVHKASKRGKTVELTYEEFLEFTKITSCHYCLSTIHWLKYQNKSKGEVSLAYNLDRKDNAKGYTKDNCVPCCSRCNLSRGDRFTYEEWVQIGRIISRWQK